MWRLIGRRVAVSVPLVFVVSLLVFCFQALAPGDTARTILGENTTPQAYLELRRRLGLDEPLFVQYGHWLGRALRGDLGVSPISGLDVGTEITNRLGVTLSLIVGTTVLAALVGVGLGLVSAVRGGWAGKVVDIVSLLGFALPNFWFALVLVAVFAIGLRMFPATGYAPPSQSPADWINSLTLPVVTLALHGVAVLAKQTRDSMDEVLSRPYVDAFRANGATETAVVLRHGLRNAAIPVVTVLGLVFVNLLNGTVFVEGVFALPGLGGLALDATGHHDTPMIQGVAVVFTLIVVLVNLLTDLAYGRLDPKVRVA